MNATYNITNDRLKFAPDSRLPDEVYQKVKAAGFQWWPGQKVFTKVWTPEAEDLINALGYTIAEDDTPDDLEARVNRFQNYAANDEATAASAAERVHTATTERRARLAEHTAERALDEALYWQQRIAGAIQRAQYRERPDVIARRIKGLEADLRKWQRAEKEDVEWSARWHTANLTDKQAVYLANYDPCHFCFTIGDARESSMWSALNEGRTTAEDAARLMIEKHTESMAHARRWIAHLTMRIDYETAYLAAVGGNPADATAEIKKGDYVLYRGEKCEVLNTGKNNLRLLIPSQPWARSGRLTPRESVAPVEG
jgi:hypothetical protein